MHNNIYLFLVVVFHEWCGISGAPAGVVEMLGPWAQPKGDDPKEQWDIGHLPSQPGYPAGCVIHAVMDIPPARAGGAEHPAGICGWILLVLHSHNPIRGSRMSSGRNTEIVTIPCGVCLGLEMPELMKAAFPESFPRVKPFPS